MFSYTLIFLENFHEISEENAKIVWNPSREDHYSDLDTLNLSEHLCVDKELFYETSVK